MKKVQTVFMVDGQTYAIDGSGQEAASAALAQFPKKVVLLHGFMMDDVFVHWQYY